MEKYINKKSIILFVFSTIAFLYLVNNFNILYFRNIDHKIIDWLLLNTNYAMIYFFELITILANWQMILLQFFVMFLLFKDKTTISIIVLTTGFASIVNETIKNNILRLRPYVLHLTYAKGYSMPSGHTLAATIFYGLIILFYISKVKDVRYRRLFTSLLVILIALIGISRIYLRVHYFTDVLAGGFLGIMFVIVMYNLKVGIFDNIKSYIEGEDFE